MHARDLLAHDGHKARVADPHSTAKHLFDEAPNFGNESVSLQEMQYRSWGQSSARHCQALMLWIQNLM